MESNLYGQLLNIIKLKKPWNFHEKILYPRSDMSKKELKGVPEYNQKATSKDSTQILYGDSPSTAHQLIPTTSPAKGPNEVQLRKCPTKTQLCLKWIKQKLEHPEMNLEEIDNMSIQKGLVGPYEFRNGIHPFQSLGHGLTGVGTTLRSHSLRAEKIPVFCTRGKQVKMNS